MKNENYQPSITYQRIEREEFSTSDIVRKVSMDFDMKRKPDRRSFYPVYLELDEAKYEIANFTTIPFETIEEFQQYRKIKANCYCLRTMEDWEQFWAKLAGTLLGLFKFLLAIGITLAIGILWTHFVYASALELVIQLITEIGINIAETQM